MYVCICNAVTDREIRQCVALGAQTFEQVRECLGVSTCCGRCEPVARQIVVERDRHHHAGASATV
jgi:bacterioferritin-associated ferredoxin